MTQTCVIYARVSTEDQAEKYGLASQLRELRAYAARAGYTIIAECCDEGYSGSTLHRPELTRLRELVNKKLVNVVIAYDPDRLSRNLARLLVLDDEFKRAGVRDEYVTMSVSDDHEGKLLFSVRGAIAEYEKEKIKERTIRGRKEKARQGLIVGGRRTFGYSLQESQYSICEAEAAVVKNIFKWFVESGLSIRAVVVRLNHSGSKPHTSDRWAKSTVHRILSNECYIGRAYYNRRERIETDSNTSFGRESKTKHDWRHEADWITVPVPPIIDHHIFAAAQKKLKRNREQKSGRPPKHNWLLRGFVKCGKCGRRFGSYPSHNRRYYRCSAVDKISSSICDSPIISADQLETLVLADLKRILRNPRLLESKLSAAEASGRDLEGEVHVIDERLRTIDEQEAKLLNAFLTDTITKSILENKARSLKEERLKLRASRDSIIQALGIRVQTGDIRKRAIAYCRKLDEQLDRLDFSRKRAVLETLIDEILIDSDTYQVRGAVSFEFTTGESSTTC